MKKLGSEKRESFKYYAGFMYSQYESFSFPPPQNTTGKQVDEIPGRGIFMFEVFAWLNAMKIGGSVEAC